MEAEFTQETASQTVRRRTSEANQRDVRIVKRQRQKENRKQRVDGQKSSENTSETKSTSVLSANINGYNSIPQYLQDPLKAAAARAKLAAKQTIYRSSADAIVAARRRKSATDQKRKRRSNLAEVESKETTAARRQADAARKRAKRVVLATQQQPIIEELKSNAPQLPEEEEEHIENSESYWNNWQSKGEIYHQHFAKANMDAFHSYMQSLRLKSCSRCLELLIQPDNAADARRAFECDRCKRSKTKDRLTHRNNMQPSPIPVALQGLTEVQFCFMILHKLLAMNFCS